MIKGDIGMMNSEPNETKAATQPGVQRRIYVKPSFECERVFETTALQPGCSPFPG
jgi:hypothetical protein